jgi:hypothetical protein
VFTLPIPTNWTAAAAVDLPIHLSQQQRPAVEIDRHCACKLELGLATLCHGEGPLLLAITVSS